MLYTLARLSDVSESVVFSGESVNSRLWRRISESKEIADLFPEFLKLATIVLTMIGTSVGNERDFSAKHWVEDDRGRASLRVGGAAHLDACLRIYLSRSLYPDLASYPYNAILKEFGETSIERRLLGATMADINTSQPDSDSDSDVSADLGDDSQ